MIYCDYYTSQRSRTLASYQYVDQYLSAMSDGSAQRTAIIIAIWNGASLTPVLKHPDTIIKIEAKLRTQLHSIISDRSVVAVKTCVPTPSQNLHEGRDVSMNAQEPSKAMTLAVATLVALARQVVLMTTYF
jgi:hypothetical protein